MNAVRRISAAALRKMSPTAIDKLPGPVKVGKKRVRWDGKQWVRCGLSDGSEPLEVICDDD